jgi:hypothetical protein
LYETIRIDTLGISCLASSVNMDMLLNSSELESSKEYLNKFKLDQPYVLKSIEILLNDKLKMSNIGSPVTLIQHEIYESLDKRDKLVNFKMRIEGNKRRADMLVEVEKDMDSNLRIKDFKISHIGLMYKLDEDYFLRSDDLAKKYSEDILNLIQPSKEEWKAIFHQINLNKVIEEKLTKNGRVMNSIGRPIKVTLNQKNGLILNGNTAKIVFQTIGRLNSGEFVIDLFREANENSWKISKSDFKIIWKS